MPGLGLGGVVAPAGQDGAHGMEDGLVRRDAAVEARARGRRGSASGRRRSWGRAGGSGGSWTGAPSTMRGLVRGDEPLEVARPARPPR